MRIHRSIPVLLVVAACCVFAACAPTLTANTNPAPTPSVAVPTLAEYLHTLAIYAGDPTAVHALEQDVFGDLGPGVVACVEAISFRESRDTWSSRNSSGASSLMQVMVPLHTALAVQLTDSGDLMNPWVNLVTARALSRNGMDWAAWTPAPNPC